MSKTEPGLEPINLGKIAYAIERGWIDPNEPITIRLLIETGLIRRCKHGVKLLGKVKIF